MTQSSLPRVCLDSLSRAIKAILLGLV